MNRSFFIGFALAGVLIACGWLVCRRFFSNEELASKVEWSIVQAVEFRHRDKPGDKIEVVKMDDYSLAGIPVPDARKEIWIMLNPLKPPYYKQLPQGSYVLSEDELKNILASGDVTSTVASCLESHVQSH